LVFADPRGIFFHTGRRRLLLALSKVRKGIIYGAAMTATTALLSVLFAMSTDALKETPLKLMRSNLIISFEPTLSRLT